MQSKIGPAIAASLHRHPAPRAALGYIRGRCGRHEAILPAGLIIDALT
jgi:hypothetical protein